MKIAAFDIETCGFRRGSICAVGAVLFEGGMETDRFYSLVHPHSSIYVERWRFGHIHGIRRADVRSSPEFPEVYDGLAQFLRTADIVVCHNAPFDLGHLKGALELYGMEGGRFSYACSLQASRALYPEARGHGLDAMAEMFRWDFRHHDALEDARIAGMLMCRLSENRPLDEWEERKIRIGMFTGR